MERGIQGRTFEWSVGPTLLRLDPAQEAPRLKQQTPDYNVLHTLAKARVDGIPRCALDIIFQWGFDCGDCIDALRAYSEYPLEDPPEQYMDMFHQVDWSSDSP